MWQGGVQSEAHDVGQQLYQATEVLRRHQDVLNAALDYDADTSTATFGMEVRHAATSHVAIYRASRALHDCLHRSGVGTPHQRAHGPAPTVRLHLDAKPESVDAC